MKDELRFRRVVPNDANWIIGLRSDPEVLRQLQHQERFNVDQCVEWIGDLGGTSERWMFQLRPDVTNVGLFRIDNIDFRNSHCSVGLDIHKDHRGKNYAKKIYKLALDELFMQWGLNRAWLEVSESNTIAIQLYKELGFAIEGTLKDFSYRDGYYRDVYRMSMKGYSWMYSEIREAI